ncbi:MAG: LPS assembly lipoprotein LptE, partial [Acidobacteriota bacterium]|nr:LPS assembly lipoprotein LptE [Acidobacteriota bacterium]
LRYRVESRFTEAVTREVIRRGRGLKVQGSRENADAVIEGTIRDFNFTGVLLDREGRARIYEVTIVVAVTVRDLQENKILFDNQNFIFRDSFEFSEDPRSFFNEEDPAVERMARAFAESVVSSIVNGLGVKEEKKGT